MKRALLKLLLAAGLALFAREALAQTQSVQINASVLRSCAVTAYSNVISIVNYDPNAATATTADGSFTITCTRGSQYTWLVGDGGNAATTRQLVSALNPAEFMTYDVLMSTDGFTTTTAAPVGMAAPVVGERSTGRTNPMTLGMRIELPANQDAATDVGDYSDTVDVTIAIAP